GYNGFGQIQGSIGRDDRVRTVGDVGERATVNQCGCSGERLHEVWADRVAQQDGHGTLCAVGPELGGGHGFAVVGVGHDDARQAFFQVVDIAREAEHGHGFGGDYNFEAVFTRSA